MLQAPCVVPLYREDSLLGVFTVDVFHKFLRYFTRSVRYFIILPRYGARHRSLRRASAANPSLMNARTRDWPIRGRVRVVFRKGLWLKLIRAVREEDIRWGSGRFYTQVLQSTSRKEQKSFSRTSRDDATPDLYPLLFPGRTPCPSPPTSCKPHPVSFDHNKQQPLMT